MTRKPSKKVPVDEYKGYHHLNNPRFSTKDRNTITRTIKTGLVNGKNPTQIINELREKGLGYTDKKMYHDIHRNQSSVYADSKSAKKDAEKWYDRTFNQYRKMNGLTHRQTAKIWNELRMKTQFEIQHLDDKDAIRQFWEIYKSGLVSG